MKTQEILKEFRENFTTSDKALGWSEIKFKNLLELENWLTTKLEQVERETSVGICRIIDQLESTDENTSFEQWKNYKRIRNTIRDKYEPINPITGNKDL